MAPKQLNVFCLICGREECEVQRMHCFPSVLDRSRVWQEKMGMVFFGDTLQQRRICNMHFTPESYVNQVTWRLRKDAVPTLLPCRAIPQTAHIDLEAGPSGVTHVQSAVLQGADQGRSVEPAEVRPKAPRQKRSVFRGLADIEKTPRKVKLMDLVKSKESQIRHLKKECRQRRDDIKSLTNLADSDIFRNCFDGMSRTTTDFLISQLRCARRNPKGRRWTVEDKATCLAMFKRSPSGYNFLRKLVALPSKKTILSLLGRVPFGAGINFHIFEHIKQCISTRNDAYVALLLDEMDIKENLQYDKKRDKIVGFEDYGPNFEAGSKIANKALVFMVCGLGEKKWKQPVAYYFSRGGCSSELLVELVKEVLLACQNLANLEVVTTICDMGTANVKAFTNLGATTEKPFFYFNAKKIFRMFDPPHLLKRIASLFRQYNVSLPVQIGEETVRMEASFEDVIEAYRQDSRTPLVFRHMGKLRQEHLTPKMKYAMKVNIAAQILSHSVAACIYSLASRNDLRQSALATATFVQQANDLFDSVNGSRKTQPEDGGNILRCQVSEKTEHMEFWAKALVAIRNWEFRRRTRTGLLKSMPPSQKGWLTTINAIRGIWEFLKSQEFKSLKTRALNQDPLENLFGCVRGGCGRADNPTVMQFVGSLKTQIINGLSTRPMGGNCEEDEATLLSNLHSFLECEEPRPVTALRSTSQASSSQTVFNLDALRDAVFTGQSCTLSVAYVSGFIAKHALAAVGQCEACSSCILGTSEEPHNLFIVNKEWSTTTHHLIYPSIELAVAVGHSVTVVERRLNSFANEANISQSLKEIVASEVAFDFLTCEQHNTSLSQEIVASVIFIALPWWCKRVNRGLKDNSGQGKKVQKFKQIKTFVKFLIKWNCYIGMIHGHVYIPFGYCSSKLLFF